MSLKPAAALEFDPFTAGSDHDPYPLYARLRDERPVYHHPQHDFYAISRFDDVQALSRDWNTFSNANGVDIDRTGDYFGPNFLDSDPPRHRLLRSLVQKRFTPQAIRETVEPVIRDQVARSMHSIREKTEVDLGVELAWALPFTVACHLLGFPPEDADFLRDASRRFIEREAGVRLPPAAAQHAAQELQDYVTRTCERRRRNPTDDLVSLLVTADVGGEPLPEREVVGNIFLMFDAGTQTTACLLTSAIRLLDANPEQRRWLAQNPSQIPLAVEECLRFESPVQHLTRTTTVDVELHGERIPANSTVALLYGAANRDASRWVDPDRFDITREPKRHVAFGEGIHHCIGAPIARMEAAIALEALLPELETLRVSSPPTRLRSHLLRGYVTLPMARV